MEHNAMEPTPRMRLDQMICGYWTSQAIYVAAKLGIADLLKDGPRTAHDLAAQTATHEKSLYRLLRALASLGIFAEDDKHEFALTPDAELLRRDVPGSQWATAVMVGEEQYRAWAELLYGVRTGANPFEKVFDKPLFEFMSEHPEKAAIFDQAMVGIHGRETAAILDAYDFSNFTAVHLVAGDFFSNVSHGADAYVLRHIIHDWDDAQALRILENVRREMHEDGRLLVIESVIPAGNEPFFGKLLDLAMLVSPGGQERTAEEYRDLYGKAGFRIARIVPTQAEVSVIEGVLE
jgi:hypothetical protein